MLRTLITQHDEYQKRLREEQEQVRIGALLQAYEQQLIIAKQKAKEHRANGTPNHELEELIVQAERQRAKTRRAAMAGVLDDSSALLEEDEEDTPPPPPVPSRRPHHRKQASASISRAPQPSEPQPSSTPIASTSTRAIEEPISPPPLTLAGAVKSTFSRFYPSQSSGQFVGSPSSTFTSTSPPVSNGPLSPFHRRLSTAARRLSAPVMAAVTRPSLPRAHTLSDTNESSAPLVRLQQSHKRRFNERIATKCTPSVWKEDANARMCCAPGCNTVFTLLERKHHCRKCGQIFCQPCSTRTEPLMDMSNEPWAWAPDQVLDQIFPLGSKEEAIIQSQLVPTPSSSFTSASGSSHGSTSHHLDVGHEAPFTRPLRRIGCTAEWDPVVDRTIEELNRLVENTTVERVCDECYAAIHGLPCPRKLLAEQERAKAEESERNRPLTSLEEKMRIFDVLQTPTEFNTRRSSKKSSVSETSRTSSFASAELHSSPLSRSGSFGVHSIHSDGTAEITASPCRRTLTIQDLIPPRPRYEEDEHGNRRPVQRRRLTPEPETLPTVDPDAETEEQLEARLRNEELRWRQFLVLVHARRLGVAKAAGKENPELEAYCQELAKERPLWWGEGIYINDDDCPAVWRKKNISKVVNGVKTTETIKVRVWAGERRSKIRAQRSKFVREIEAEIREEELLKCSMELNELDQKAVEANWRRWGWKLVGLWTEEDENRMLCES